MTIQTKPSSLRVLFQNRPGLKQQPGGDTVVMDNHQKYLESQGHIVDVNSDPRCDLSSYDIVHLYNLTLPALTDPFAKNTVLQTKPFVVTSLQEDFPLYINKCIVVMQLFQMYLQNGQRKDVWQKGMDFIAQSPPAPCELTTSPFAVEYADRLLTCGDTEAKFIKSRFPKAKCETVFFGSTIKESTVGPELFQEQFGVRDFVLCVGRIEMRKNQLMLLKALEDDDVPLVFADGGFSYQPGYVDLCRNFKRKGKTIFTGRLSHDALISAFRAASVHCLPSWYELPGLVTLEAARYGSRIVASSWGAIGDYMKDTITYCQPDSSESIRNAIFNAMALPNDAKQKDLGSSYTWEKSGEHLVSVYTNAIDAYDASAIKALGQSGIFDSPLNAVDFLQRVTGLVEAGKNKDAIAFFDAYRKTFQNMPDLERFDALIARLKTTVRY